MFSFFLQFTLLSSVISKYRYHLLRENLIRFYYIHCYGTRIHSLFLLFFQFFVIYLFIITTFSVTSLFIFTGAQYPGAASYRPGYPAYPPYPSRVIEGYPYPPPPPHYPPGYAIQPTQYPYTHRPDIYRSDSYGYPAYPPPHFPGYVYASYPTPNATFLADTPGSWHVENQRDSDSKRQVRLLFVLVFVVTSFFFARVPVSSTIYICCR